MSQHHRDVLYCEHSGDIVRSFEAWNSGHHLSSETSITFSGQFFEICRSEELTALAISGCARGIEEDKGVFGILEIARSLRDRRHQIEFVFPRGGCLTR